MTGSPRTSYYGRWYRHFSENRLRGRRIPWEHTGLLTASEQRMLGRSIQQFQLGEWARGRGLRRRAARNPVLAADPWFLPALELFIAEEQQHSAILGRFLDHEGIPHLRHHWVDGVFRRLRKVAGLEACAVVLVTAEILAISFYQALHEATESPLLRAVCAAILRDEAGHLQYQALTLGLIRRPLGGIARRLRCACHSVLFRATAVLLWQQHRRVFQAAGWSFHRFWEGSRAVFERLQMRIGEYSAWTAPAEDVRTPPPQTVSARALKRSGPLSRMAPEA